MEDEELVRFITELEIDEEDSDSDDQLCVPRRRNGRRIVSDSESKQEEGQDVHSSGSEESFRDFTEVTVGNDTEYNPRPLFLETVGPKHMPPKNSLPIIYFNLFFTVEFLEMLKTETNRYAKAFFDRTPRISIASRTMDWKKTTVLEMRAFIAVLLEMGITCRPTLFSYWSTNHRYIPWFGQMFSRNKPRNKNTAKI